VQPHNFTRDLPEPHEVEEILRLIREGSVRWLDMAYGEPSIMISKCLRGFIKAGSGRALMGGDFANVEGRGLAWLAGEEWKLEAFAECDFSPDLPDMYVRAYAKTFNVNPSAVTKEQRQIGKVEELAFGYQGGVGAFRTMGKNYNVLVVPKITEGILHRRKGALVITEAQADDFKRGWRDAHPRVKQYWYDLQDAAIRAVQFPGEIFGAGAPGRAVKFRKRGSFLWCRLPSGRTLCFPYPAVYNDEYGPQLSFKSVPDAVVWARFVSEKEQGKPNTTYIVDEPGNAREWCRISTYGGKLSENITQAICRDLLAEAMLRVEAAEFEIVLHVHDEVIVEGVFNEKSREHFERLMCQVPVWAAGFPIKAGCWLSERYIKG
jgi:DNA polymerase